MVCNHRLYIKDGCKHITQCSGTLHFEASTLTLWPSLCKAEFKVHQLTPFVGIYLCKVKDCGYPSYTVVLPQRVV